MDELTSSMSDRSELPVELDGRDEPSPLAIERIGLAVCAVIAELDPRRCKIISSSFRDHGASSHLKLYGWTADYLRMGLVGIDLVADYCDAYSHLHLAFFDSDSGNLFYRHQENELLLFMGSASFVRACLAITSLSIEEEMELVVRESNFFDEDKARHSFITFLKKYNSLPNFVGSDQWGVA